MERNSGLPIEYPPYPYQKRRQYEVRLINIFPTSALIALIEVKIAFERLENYKEFQILVTVHKLSKGIRERAINQAKRYINLYDDYVEAAFPELWEEEGIPQPKYLGFEIEVIKPRISHLPYWYKRLTSSSLRQVRLKKRRMIDYSRSYQLDFRLLREHKRWFLNFVYAFLYCHPIHRLDFVQLEFRAKTFDNQYKTLIKDVLTKTPLRMPIWGTPGSEGLTRKKLDEIFSNFQLLSLLEDQLSGRYPFVWGLALYGEPIPIRKGLKLDSKKDIRKCYQESNGVEYYRSVDKRGVDKVDTILQEYDPPLRMEDGEEEIIWRQTVEDEERSLGILLSYGLKLESLEENFSGNKSLQRLIHIFPSISYVETRDIQYFLANLHKFEVAKDPYMYTIDKDSGLARVSRELVDWSYGRKKEIKCVPVPNLKRGPVHLSIPLRFGVKNGEIKFDAWVHNLDAVREASKWENVRQKISEDEDFPPAEKLYKPQSYYEKNATDPAIFRKLMEEFHWYREAMRNIPPYELDLWRKEWIRESFT